MPRRTRRRDKGTGSITFDKGRGKYVARLPDPGIGSAPKKLFDTEAEAEAWLDQKLDDLKDGIAVDGIPTLTAWLDHWHQNVIKVRLTTHESYGEVLRGRVKPYLGRYRLDELERTPELIERWIAQLEREDYAHYSIRNAFRLLRSALAVAVARDKIRKNPTDSIKLRRPDDDDEPKGYAMSPAEVARFLAAVEGHRLYPLYYVALRTGMRQAELIGLRRVNLRLDDAQPHIRVREQIRTAEGRRQVFKPKSKASKRDIPLDADLVAVLRQALESQVEERERRGAEWREQLLVFPSEVGTPLGDDNLRRHFKGVLRRAGLPNIRFHDIRHTAGSLMLRNNPGALVDVSKILGHSSIAVTAAIYIHSFEDTMRSAIAGTAALVPARKVG